MKRNVFGIVGIFFLATGFSQTHAQVASSLAPEAQIVPRTHAAVSTSTPNAPALHATSPATNFPALEISSTLADGGVDSDSPGGSSMAMSDSLITVGSSLVVVLGLFGALVWVTRKFGNRSMTGGVIPTEVMQSLGSSAIDSRTRITLVRCGSRILVLAQTASGIQPLSEITHPEEVRQVTALCSGDSKKEFASTLQSIEQERAPSGYVGTTADDSSARSRGRLFATA